MAGIKIHQYPLERTSIGDEDYYDIDYWTGSSYQSAKIKGSTLKNVLGANYIDITAFISGYELTDKDAGKLITNSNSNVRTLVIPSGLSLPNNMITVKGRVAIQPKTGVNITLPDGSTITEPSQFTCVADEVYILHKSAFSGDDYILVSIKKSENIGTNDLIITDTIRELQVAENGTFQIVTNDANNSASFIVGENSNERFSEIQLNSVTYDVTTAEPNPTNNGAGIITRINPNEYEIESRSDIGNAGTKRGRIYMSPNETIFEQVGAGRLTFNKLGAFNTFEDLRATKKGLEYYADYSANFSIRSLVDKGYVDGEISGKPTLYTNNGTIGSGRVVTLTDTLSFSGGRVSFDTTTNGILLPRITTAEMNAIVSPATHLLVFNTDLNGLYRYNGSAWVTLSAGYGIIEVRDASGYPTFYADLQTAINATGDIDIIYIHSDIQVTAQISVPYKSSLTIKMNGHRIWYDTTSGDFNLFRFASAPTSGVDRVFILDGGGTLEQVGSVVSTTNAAVIHFFYTGTQRQLQIIAGTTNIKTENAFLIFNQNHLRLIDGGFWYSTNGTISINTSTSLIKNASIDIYAQASVLTTYIDNCHLNTRWGAFWITGGIVNSRISGAVLQTGSSIGMIMCSGNDIIANNVIENGTGAVNWAINCYYAGSSGRISNNTIYSANAGVYLRYGSASNNYIYSATSRAITKTSLGAGYAIGNVCITNATNVEAIYTTGGAGIINNYCISLNATNTASAFRTDGASENIFGNTFIVSNPSAANANLAGNVYLAKNIMGNVGTGITGAGVNLMTNTMDAFGNIKIG